MSPKPQTLLLVSTLVILCCAHEAQAFSASAVTAWLGEIASMIKVVSKDIPKQLALVDGGKPADVVVEQPLTETFYARPALIYAIQAENSKHDLIDFHGILMQDSEAREGGYHWADLVDTDHPLFPWSPKISPFHVRGAAEIYIETEKGSNDMSLRVPHLVEAGALSRVKVHKDTEVVIFGSSHVYLKEPIDVDLRLPSSPIELFKSLKTSTVPRLIVKNPYQINSGDTKLKVKRIGKTQVEVSNDMKALQTTTGTSKSLSLYRDQTSVQLSSLLGSMSNSVVKSLLSSHSKHNTTELKPPSAPQMRIKRIISASAKAVVLYEFAAEAKFKVRSAKKAAEESSLLLDIAVAKDDSGQFTLVGLKQREVYDTISTDVNNFGNHTSSPLYTIELNEALTSLPSPF